MVKNTKSWAVAFGLLILTALAGRVGTIQAFSDNLSDETGVSQIKRPPPEWEIVYLQDDSRWAIQNIENKNLRHVILSQGQVPHYAGSHRIKSLPIIFLVYFSGSAGTSEIVDIYRTVLFNTKKEKFYGDFPFRVTSSLPDRSYPDTVFTFQKEHFTVEDANTESKQIIKY